MGVAVLTEKSALCPQCQTRNVINACSPANAHVVVCSRCSFELGRWGELKGRDGGSPAVPR